MNYYPTTTAQKAKGTNKQSSLLTLTVSQEKRSWLIKSKKKKYKVKQKTIKKKGIKKLIKMIIEAMIAMISWHYNTMKKRNIANQNIEKWKKTNSKAIKRSVN